MLSLKNCPLSFLSCPVKDPCSTEFERDRYRPYRNRNSEDVQAGQHGQQGQDYQRQQWQSAFLRSVTVFLLMLETNKHGERINWYVSALVWWWAEPRWQLERQKQLPLERGHRFSNACSHTHTGHTPHPAPLCMYRAPIPPSMSHRLILQRPLSSLNLGSAGIKRSASTVYNFVTALKTMPIWTSAECDREICAWTIIRVERKMPF